MSDDDFPSLYLDANRTSIDTQNHFLLATKVVIAGSLLTGGLGMIPDHAIVTIVQVLLGLCVLTAACYLLFGKPQKIWYSTRALAESVKTISWRYVTRADPFGGERPAAAAKFRETVSEILRANEEASALRFASAHSDLITPAMEILRRSNLDTRRSTYLADRIEDQLGWYQRKARWNDRRSKFWYIALIAISLLAVASSLTRLSYSFTVPIDWVFSVPIAILGWVQIKRFQELASSYSLTAHEIVFAKNELAQVRDEAAFSDFVGNTENAFSREHTQWYARKDLG